MSRSSIIRPRKARVFVGCEGKSEFEYVRFISLLCDQAKLPVHIVADNLAPQGDPLARVETAIKRIKHLELSRDIFAFRCILLDDDQNDQALQRAAKAKQLAQQNAISLIWQSPNHEAMLLRHFEGHTNDRPQTSAIAEQQLKAVWPEYTKGMERREIGKRLDIDTLKRATGVEPDLGRFLTQLGLIYLD
jgi:RloB-like protein